MSEEIKQSYLNRAKKDKFKMVFDVPPILKSKNNTVDRTATSINRDAMQFSIWGTMVPRLTVKAVETRHAGSTLYVSSHSRDSYPPVTLKFNVDANYDNYWVIYTWLNLLHDQYSGIYNADKTFVGSKYPSFTDYQTDITIFGLDEYENEVIKFTYTKAFVTELAELEYSDQDSGDQQLVSGMTFVYSQLHTERLNLT